MTDRVAGLDHMCPGGPRNRGAGRRSGRNRRDGSGGQLLHGLIAGVPRGLLHGLGRLNRQLRHRRSGDFAGHRRDRRIRRGRNVVAFSHHLIVAAGETEHPHTQSRSSEHNGLVFSHCQIPFCTKNSYGIVNSPRSPFPASRASEKTPGKRLFYNIETCLSNATEKRQKI